MSALPISLRHNLTKSNQKKKSDCSPANEERELGLVCHETGSFYPIDYCPDSNSHDQPQISKLTISSELMEFKSFLFLNSLSSDYIGFWFCPGFSTLDMLLLLIQQ